jgi:hypothetical protein
VDAELLALRTTTVHRGAAMRWNVTDESKETGMTDEHYAACMRLQIQSAKEVCTLADTIQVGFSATLALTTGLFGVLCSLAAAAFYRGGSTVDLVTTYVSLALSCLAAVGAIVSAWMITRDMKLARMLANAAQVLVGASVGGLIGLAFNEAFL